MSAKKVGFVLYICVLTACCLYAGMRGSHYPGVRCRCDVLCDMGYYGARLAIPFAMVWMMFCYHRDFRVGVLLRYQSIYAFLRHLLGRTLCLSAVLSLAGTVIAWVCSGVYASKLCNWSEASSYAMAYYGVILPEPVSVWKIIVWYLWVMFVQAAVTATVLCLMWWLTQSPVSGFIAVMILLVLEATSLQDLKLFYNVVSIQEINVLRGAFSLCRMVAYPLCLLLVLYGCMAVILVNRDYLRFNG